MRSCTLLIWASISYHHVSLSSEILYTKAMPKVFCWFSTERQGWQPFFRKRCEWLLYKHWQFLCIISVIATFIFSVTSELLDRNVKYVPLETLRVVGAYTMVALLMIAGSITLFMIILFGFSQFRRGRVAFDRFTSFQKLTEIEKLDKRLDILEGKMDSLTGGNSYAKKSARRSRQNQKR